MATQYDRGDAKLAVELVGEVLSEEEEGEESAGEFVIIEEADEFEDAAGEMVTVVTTRPFRDQVAWEGELVRREEDGVTIDVGGDQVTIPTHLVKEVRVATTPDDDVAQDDSPSGDRLGARLKRGRRGGRKAAGFKGKMQGAFLTAEGRAGRRTNRISLVTQNRLKETAAREVNLRQIGWTIQAIYDEKYKCDAVDELEFNKRLSLGLFVPEYFHRQSGVRDLALRKLVTFKEGLLSAANNGNRRAYAFGVLAGYSTLDGDAGGLLAERVTCQWYLELERKATRASGSRGGADVERSEGALVWLPIDRAVELMRNEFKFARPADTARFTLGVEELLRLPDEIHEIMSARETASAWLTRRETVETDHTGLPLGNDAQLFADRPEIEQQRILRRREEALVQNKVLRAIARRGLSLRDTFDMIDTDNSGELDSAEFLAGIASLEPNLTEGQAATLMSRIDTDANGTVDWSELSRLQKLDLRVELSDYLIVCLRFFLAELERSAAVLREKFENASAGAPGTPPGVPGADGKPTLDSDGVKRLLKSLDAPFLPTAMPWLLTEMVKLSDQPAAPAAKAPKKKAKDAAMGLVEVDPSARINAAAFVRVCVANGFHALASPVFKEVGQATLTVTLAATHLLKSAKKLKMGSTKS